MELIFVFLLFASVFYGAYQFLKGNADETVTLPDDIKNNHGEKNVKGKSILNFTAQFTDKLVKQDNAVNNPLFKKLKKKLLNAGSPLTVSQFIAFKFLLMAGLPVAGFVLLRNSNLPTAIFIAAGAVGFLFPEFWLNNIINKRRRTVLRDLPYIIDLLNICVGAGLDFMVAVNHVTREFKSGVLVDELKNMVKEIQMGVARKDALKNLAYRINSPEVNSFVRTLIQADRMGTPITAALKMHAEELRNIRFQKGEEMALKAPIKLLFPLMAFILPVVLLIVGGPVMLQFMRGGVNILK